MLNEQSVIFMCLCKCLILTLIFRVPNSDFHVLRTHAATSADMCFIQRVHVIYYICDSRNSLKWYKLIYLVSKELVA